MVGLGFIRFWDGLHQWRWTEESPFPPISHVHQAAIYTNAEYKGLLERLQNPVPVPTVTGVPGKTYITLDTTTASVSEGSLSEEKCVDSPLDGWVLVGWVNCFIR